MIISFIGNDGSGKTTIAKKLYDVFYSLNLDVYYEHEYEYGIIKFFFKLIGSQRLEQSKQELVHEKKLRLRYYLWPFLVWLDRYIHYYNIKINKRNSVYILDRYIYDHYMSFRYSGVMTRLAKLLYLHFPRPDFTINLWVEPQTAYERKKDTHTFPLEFYKSQTSEYKRLSARLGIPLINTNQPIDNTIKQILHHIIANSYKKDEKIIEIISNLKLKSKIDSLSIIIPTFNRNEKLEQLLESLLIELQNITKTSEIIVVDDSKELNAKPLVSKFLEKFKNIAPLKYLHSSGDEYPSVCRNIGAYEAQGDILFFIDDDNKLSGNAIQKIVELMEENSLIGEMGILNYTPDGKIWCTGGKTRSNPFVLLIGNTKDEDYQKGIKIVDFIPNLYAIRRQVFLDVGGFDTTNFPIAFEEGDLALRIWRSGYVVCVYLDRDIYSVHLTEDTKNQPMRPNRYYIRGRSRILYYAKFDKHLLLWKGIPDIVFRSLITFRYKIPLSMRKKLISEYIRGIKDGFKILNGK